MLMRKEIESAALDHDSSDEENFGHFLWHIDRNINNLYGLTTKFAEHADHIHKSKEEYE